MIVQTAERAKPLPVPAPVVAPRTRRATPWLVVAVVVAVVAGVLFLAKGRGLKSQFRYWVFGGAKPFVKQPTVTQTRPPGHAGLVSLDAFVAADVDLPNPGYVIDARTITPTSVLLVRTADRVTIPSSVNTSGAGDAISLTPLSLLDPNTQYSFEVTPELKDTSGASFRNFVCSFTTAAGSPVVEFPVAFEKIALPAADGNMYTCVTVGPDRRLYAATMDGRVLRFPIGSDGTLGKADVIEAVQKSNSGPRLITGVCFDPAATAENLVLWVSHGHLAIKDSPDWSGKISRLSGPDLSVYQDVVVNLPRGMLDHLNNQLAFGPDGAAYFSQAGCTAMGAPDPKWGYRPEHMLSGAILRLDLAKLPASLPLDAKTEEGGSYDPFAPSAPLTLYATGVRNGFDLLWHRNGRLYVPVNGSAAGGNTPGWPTPGAPVPRRIDDEAQPGSAAARPLPAVPALNDVRETQDDFLFILERGGGYYGHPNAARGEFVLDGGNPTAGVDPFEVLAYPVGVQPDRNWRGRNGFSFGKNLSPNGLIEYKGKAFGGALEGKILVTRYSGGDDLIVLTPGPDGTITESLTGIDGTTQLMDPLDLTQDETTGCLYVSETKSRKLTLLRPKEGAKSTRVFRQLGTGPASAAGEVH